jgi:dTDP-4-dehydrorhamnose reductase
VSLLIIGHDGQLARALGETLPDAPRLGRAELDIADAEAVARVVAAQRPDIVINAAAFTDVDGAEDAADAAFAVNRDGPAALARACASAGATLVHVSTDYVFDGSGARAWREDDPTGPLNVYGASKLAGEEAALAANPRTLVLRTSWVYSPWGRNFVTTMLRLADRDRLTVVDDQIGSPTSALSLARAIRDILPRFVSAGSEAPVWGIRHYAGAGSTSWAGFAREIFARAQGRLVEAVPEVAPIRSADYPTRARRPLNSRLDCAAFTRDFGIATEPWDQALAEVLDRLAAERAGG